jgi:hypothetical protein
MIQMVRPLALLVALVIGDQIRSTGRVTNTG